MPFTNVKSIKLVIYNILVFFNKNNLYFFTIFFKKKNIYSTLKSVLNLKQFPENLKQL